MSAGTAVRSRRAADRVAVEGEAVCVRRARPLLGTLVEIGAVRSPGSDADAAIDAAFASIAIVQQRLSRFEPTSDIGRFNAAPANACIDVGDDARSVLALAATLRDASDCAFDLTLGTGARAWRCDARGLHKLSEGVRIDLGGIGKGYAVDRAVDALVEAGVGAGWVNAGGDLRAFGAIALPIDLRDEVEGGVRRFGTLAEGAFATSRIADACGNARHASVAAPRCIWADALTKIVVARGDAADPLLARYGARAWLHAAPTCAGPVPP